MEGASACDSVWPADDADPTDFAYSVTEHLLNKWYCTIQMRLSSDEQAEVKRSVAKLNDPLIVPEEFMVDYLGRNNATKAIQLGYDTPDRKLADHLRVCDRQMTQLGLMLNPMTEPYLGFVAAGRTQGLARLRYSNGTEAAQLRPAPLVDDDIEDGVMEQHLSFLQSRRVCMLYMIDNDGGQLFLYPKDEDRVTIPLQKNMLVLFRHDYMSFEYRPEGIGLALQSWMSTTIRSFELEELQGDKSCHDEVVGIVGAPRPNGIMAQVMSMGTRLPANGTSGSSWWALAMSGTDTCTQWPFPRYDEKLYYSPDPTGVAFGKSYTNHGGFLTDGEVFGLDNSFFNLSERECKAMSINQRMWLEVGYSTLHAAEFTKRTLSGKKIGVFIGDVGSDWHQLNQFASLVAYDPEFSATSLHSAACCSRISHLMNLEGPTMTFDTACSASLYAFHHANMNMINFLEWGSPSDGALVGGVNSLGPMGHVSNSMGNLLSHVGRCFTFDEAADGYQRGEGSGGLYLKMTNEFKDLEERLAGVLATCSSQDGKSASLTAPSGPSQQMMHRHALRMANIDSLEIGFTECHGTGTALGDPIEMGALIAVYNEDRPAPLLHTTPKTNLGHLESGAGVSGLTRCILALNYQLACPNVHFRRLNPHMEQEGFPRHFQSEITATGLNSTCSGVSSFGFAGANARAEFYGKATKGPWCKDEVDVRKLDYVSVPCPQCLGPMCWRCGAAIPSHCHQGRHRCTLLRDEVADYEVCNNCYVGKYRYGSRIPALVKWKSDTVSIIGSWNRWTYQTEMEQVQDGVYVCAIVLGDTCWEHFQLIVNDDFNDAFYPACPRANASMRISGPAGGRSGKYWIIDGIADNKPQGTMYKVKFRWADPLKISWKAIEKVGSEVPVVNQYNEAKYYVCGTWNRFSMQEMTRRGSIYEFSFRMSELGMGREEFYFMRNRDKDQLIYPDVDMCEDETIFVRGPDGGSGGIGTQCRKWKVVADRREVVGLRLQNVSGNVVVTVIMPRNNPAKCYKSREKIAGHTYHLSMGSESELLPMVPDEDRPFVYKYCLSMAEHSRDEAMLYRDFQIIVDEDRTQVMYPATHKAQPNTTEGLLMGPDDKGGTKKWRVAGHPDMRIMIWLDMSQPDRRRMVTSMVINPNDPALAD